MILGTIFGCFGGAIQTGRLGRRYSIMIDSCTFLGATLMMAFSPNFEMVLAARFLKGYAIGSGRVAVPIYTSEICQPEVRKYTGAFPLIFHLSGMLVAAILGMLYVRGFTIFKI